MMLFLRLFYEFFKTGLFSVGGGMATIPFLYDMSDKTGWFTHGDLANMIAVGESTPGPIGVNMATYVGYISGGEYGTFGSILGAIIATLGLITPSIIIILIVAKMLTRFKDSAIVGNAFYGLRPASMGLIASAGLTVIVANLFIAQKGFTLDAINIKGWILAICIWLLTNVIKPTKKLHPIIFIALAAVAGIVFKM